MPYSIYWRTKDISIIEKIRKRFNIPSGITLNGETPLPETFNTEDPIFRETVRRGFIDLRKKI